jgi:hypothetical protein
MSAGSDDSNSLKLDEGEVTHLRSLMYEQSDAGAEVVAVEEEIDRCVRLEIVPSWDTLRDSCNRLSTVADTADELPELLNYLLDTPDEQS